MSDFENNKNKYSEMEEFHRMSKHDCVNNRDECDIEHPNFAKTALATPPCGLVRHQRSPKTWRNYLMAPKVIINYYDKMTMSMKFFNASEAFEQMGTNGKLNVMHNMYFNLLDDMEKSLFIGDIMERQNDKDS